MSAMAMWRRLCAFVFRDRMQRELEEEMRAHVALRAEALRQGGMTAADAGAVARRRFGNALALAEASEESWGLMWLATFGRDVRHAGRRLAKRPGFAAAVIVVLGLGIGASTAMFSAVDAAMLRPLPFRDADRLVELPRVRVPFDAGPGQSFGPDPYQINLSIVRQMPELFSAVSAYASGWLNLSDPDHPVRLRVGVVTPEFFPTLGVGPAMGREFTRDDAPPDGPHAVILSDATWRGPFGARPMIGTTIRLNDRPYQVVGVMPPRFSFPDESAIWIPMAVPNTFATFEPFRGFLNSTVIARLAPGVPVATANRQLLARWAQAVTAVRSNADPQSQTADIALDDLRQGGAVVGLQQSLSGSRRTALLLLLGATGFLLLIACANVTNLLLSEASARGREMALRTVLGATRGRILRQLLTESLLLALAGVAAGMLVAPLVLGSIRAVLPAQLAGVAPTRIDWRVFGFAMTLGLVTGVGFGLWPARAAAGTVPDETLKGSARTTTRSRRGHRALVIAELALTLVLITGAGLMLHSFTRLMGVDRGMDTSHVGSLELAYSAAVPPNLRLSRTTEMLDRLTETPGITAGAAVNDLPLGGAGGISVMVEAGAGATQPPMERRFARYLMVSAGYFEVMGIRMLKGRDFTPRDDSLAPPSVIINEAMAKLYFPSTNPIGGQLKTTGRGGFATVIGVVADVRELRLDEPALPQMYQSLYANTPGTVALVARGRGDAGTLLSALRGAVRAIDPSQAVDRVKMMDDVVATAVAPRRVNTLLISLFAGLALLLAVLGVYAVVSYGVAQRTREFGIRAALGATNGDLVRQVTREVGRMVIAGLALGLLGAWAVVRVIRSMLFEVGAHDGVTFVGAPVLLGLVALLAGLVPVRRLSAVNPAEVIRSD